MTGQKFQKSIDVRWEIAGIFISRIYVKNKTRFFIAKFIS